MVFDLRKALAAAMLGGVCGLCAAQTANTTAAGSPAALPGTTGALAQPARVALLLPLHSSAFGPAADAVRTGFLTAYEHDGRQITVNIVETGDTPQEMLSAYGDAAAANDIVVGPLSRSGVTAVVASGRVSKPTIALTQPDLGDTPAGLPSQLLLLGLSVEDEARQVAQWVAQEKAPGKIFALSTALPWQRRAAKAFLMQARKIGLQVDTMELAVTDNTLSASGLAQLLQRLQSEKPALIFVALDASQARQLRSAIGSDIPLYGTSQLNPLTLGERDAVVASDAAAAVTADTAAPALASNAGMAGTVGTVGTAASAGLPSAQAPAAVNALATPLPNVGNATDEKIADLEGVRLVDIPWQLQANAPAVMAYPRRIVNAGEKHDADLERLYAMGIDAYRVARELAQQRREFDIDGVTGKLSIDMEGGPSLLQRMETPAVYRNGVPTALPMSLPPTGRR